MSTQLFDGTFIIPLCDGNGFIHSDTETGRIVVYEYDEKGNFIATEEINTEPAIDWAEDDIQVWTNPLDDIFTDDDGMDSLIDNTD